MGRKARRRKRRMRSRSRRRRRKEQEEVTDVRRARRRHLRRIRMRGGEVQWPEKYREVQRGRERYGGQQEEEMLWAGGPAHSG